MSTLILTNGEKLIGLAEALKPYGTHPATGARWCSSGIRTKSGQRLRLESVRVGVKLRTSAEAVKRFLSALSDTTDAAPPVPTARQRRKAVDRAEAELIAAGA